MIPALQQTILQLLTGNVLMYVIVGGVFSLIVGAFAIDRNGSTWIVVALPAAGAIIAPAVAFIVALLTDTVFSFSLPGLLLPMLVVGAFSLLLCYGYSSDMPAPVKT